MQNNTLIAFLSEAIQRLSTKAPKFFVVLQWVSGFVSAITGLPEALASFGITLPPQLTVFENKIVAIASLVALVMAKLPVQHDMVSKDSSGAPLVKLDPKKLPFSASKLK